MLNKRTTMKKMKRDLLKLNKQQFDVLIVGGGIHGATTAFETARSGLKTALIEKEDFSHATSANSLKIIHGGFRYLQHLNFKRMRESIVSRREMMRIAPNLVKKLPCIMPTYSHGLKGKEIFGCALFIYNLISWDRNYHIEPENQLPLSRVLSKEKCSTIFQNIHQKGFNGAAQWYDAIAINTERLTLNYIRKAVQYGACVANYVKSVEAIIHDSRIVGVKAKDYFSGEEFDIYAKTTVNAMGPWVERNLLSADIRNIKKREWAKAINIIVKKEIFPGIAVGLEGNPEYMDQDALLKRQHRLYFFVPWRGYTMIGTNYKKADCNPDEFLVTADDIREMVDEVNKIYPAAELLYNDVTFFHGGMLPMKEGASNTANSIQLDKTSRIVDYEKKDGIKSLLSIFGVKYTTAPIIAKKVLGLISKNIKPSLEVNIDQPIYNSFDDADSIHRDLRESNFKVDETILKHIIENYGDCCGEILKYIYEEPRLADLVSLKPLITAAEIIFAVREEMALKLSDIVFRRTAIATAECPSHKTLGNIVEIMGKEFDWDEKRKQKEIEEVMGRFSLINELHS
jgi:glycerol-3-phosphate dehydrogenase